MQRIVNVVCVIAATYGVAGCTSYDSATNLNPAGPPMVQQVRLKEDFTAAGQTTAVPRRVFAFGTHPMATDAEAHPVTTAASQGNSLRVIMDELLVGNSLEEIACRQVVDDDAYARVPAGTNHGVILQDGEEMEYIYFNAFRSREALDGLLAEL